MALHRCKGYLLAVAPKFDGWDRVEMKFYPRGSEGAAAFPKGVRYVRMTVPFAWQPEWRSA